MMNEALAPHSSPAGTPAAVGPDGTLLTAEDLPPPDTTRWVSRRKAEVVAGVRAGVISLEEACRRYALSIEEFLSWERRFDAHGLRGLRATQRPGAAVRG